MSVEGRGVFEQAKKSLETRIGAQKEQKKVTRKEAGLNLGVRGREVCTWRKQATVYQGTCLRRGRGVLRYFESELNRCAWVFLCNRGGSVSHRTWFRGLVYLFIHSVEFLKGVYVTLEYGVVYKRETSLPHEWIII